jgi:HlyD family secretion protein
MTILRMHKDNRPVSGSGMDQAVETRSFSTRVKIAIGVCVALLAALAFWWFAPSGASQTIGMDRLTLSSVTRGTFDDFMPLRARVTPLLTVYIDAVEGGRVEKMLVEDGATVAAGQPIALLSNAELQLSTLARQTEVEQQINNMRSQELALAQTRLSNERAVLAAETVYEKARRQYEREQPLAGKGFVSGKQFADTQADFELSQRNLAALKRSQSTDARLQGSQLSQQQAAAKSMQSGLSHRPRQSRCAPAARAGRRPALGLFGPGRPVAQRGERVGQIDSPGRNKLIAGVDEFYLGRVQLGQQALSGLERQALRRQGHQDLSAGAERPVPGRSPVHRRRAAPIQRGQTMQAR